MSANALVITATTQVTIGIGKLKGILVSSGTNPSFAVYDSSTASTSDRKLIDTTVSAAGQSLTLVGETGVGFSKGLYFVLAGTNPIMSVFWE